VPVDYEGIITNASDGSVARYYDPATGQFLSIDPDVAQTDAPFSYAGNDPVNDWDPLGLADVGIRTLTQCELYSNDGRVQGSGV
jgi:RHS repeat-associated protein